MHFTQVNLHLQMLVINVKREEEEEEKISNDDENSEEGKIRGFFL